MSPARRRQMVDREHPSLSLVRQCALLGVSRSSLYYRPKAASAEDLSLMGEIDRQYLETPFFGSRRMKAWLDRRGVIFQGDSARIFTNISPPWKRGGLSNIRLFSAGQSPPSLPGWSSFRWGESLSR